MLQQITRTTRQDTTARARQQELGRIHQMAAKLGLSEEARRGVYLSIVGERSAALFSAAQRAAVLAFLAGQLNERQPVYADESDAEALDIISGVSA